MKHIRLLISLCFIIMTALALAQNVPQAINFQAIARDANNEVLASTDIMIQLTILDGSADGPQVYREIRSLTTNAYGSFSFQIGRNPYMANGVFSEIDWADSHKFLKIDYDPTATLSFNLSLGTIEFVSVPYAFAAGSVTFIDATGANDGDILTYNAETGRFEPKPVSIPDWAMQPTKPTYDYSEIENTPDIPEVPTNVSAFANDANYLTEETQTLADAAAKGNSVNSQIKNVIDPTDAQDVATKAYVDAKIAELDDRIATLELSVNGTLKGVFSVSDSTKVRFSKGNLQYNASTDTWRFAENQWDYVGDGNANISETYDGWIDLFGWGTGDNPTNTSTSNSDYGTFVDWGNNPISNGGNTANQWRTLTSAEWDYLLSTRSTTSGIRYVKAKLNDISGVIILPDDWSASYYTLSGTNTSNATYTTNTISSADWTGVFEANGAVFLAASGIRYGSSSVGDFGADGNYWSSSNIAQSLFFGAVNFHVGGGHRYYGQSVRLVTDY